MLKLAPTVKRSAFVDDRQYWQEGDNAASQLHTAISAAKQVDDTLGWKTNDKQCEIAASTATGRQAMRERFGRKAGKTITTLGLTHDLEQPLVLLNSLVASLFLWAAAAIPAPLASLQPLRQAMVKYFYGFLPQASSHTVAFAAAPAQVDIAVSGDLRFLSYMMLLCRRPLHRYNGIKSFLPTTSLPPFGRSHRHALTSYSGTS